MSVFKCAIVLSLHAHTFLCIVCRDAIHYSCWMALYKLPYKLLRMCENVNGYLPFISFQLSMYIGEIYRLLMY